MTTAYIYGLVHPDTHEIKYIGRSKTPEKRYKFHCAIGKNAYEACYPKTIWIDGLRDQGKKPYLVIIEECTTDNWKEREVFWIWTYRYLGMGLWNGHAPKPKDFQLMTKESV